MGARIAIAGAGIGGLATAALAHDAGHQVTLFERFDTPRPLGSGLVIQPVGLAVLDRIGAGAEARALGQPIARMLGHEAATGRAVLDVAYRAGDPGLAIHRASLFHALWGAVQTRGLPVITSAEVAAAPLDGPGRRLVLADGRDFGPFDLVVDASGAGSALSPLRARALSYGAVWGTVPWPDGATLPTNELRQRYRRADRMVGVLPIGRMPGQTRPLAAIFWSLPAARIGDWQTTATGAWKAEATALWPDMAPFLDAITGAADMIPARYSHGTLSRPHGRAIAYIGDAAHRASPQLGRARTWRFWMRWRWRPRSPGRSTRRCRITRRCGAGMCDFIRRQARCSRRCISPKAAFCRFCAT